MPFEPGKSGNPGGRSKKQKLTHDALLVELKSRETDDDPRGLRKVMAKVVDLAETGERWATEFIRDTIDGKPAQVVVGDSDEDPINLNIELDAERFTRAIAGLAARAGTAGSNSEPESTDEG